MIVIGIDVGKKGGVVALNALGRTLVILPIEEGLTWLISDGWDNFEKHGLTHVFVEKAQVMARDNGGSLGGSRSSFTYGVGFGEILGILRAKKIPHTLVPPAVWMKAMHAGCKGGETKERSLEAAKRLFPGESWMIGKQRIPQDGLYEAALIAAYGLRVLSGGAK